MTRNPTEFPEGGDAELERALRAAVSTPFDEVDWDALHGRILEDARARSRGTPEVTYDYVAAWSSRGIPFAAGSLAAAAMIILFWLPRPVDSDAEAPRPGAWPTAEELMHGLPDETRVLLGAGADPEAIITALMVHGREGENR